MGTYSASGKNKHILFALSSEIRRVSTLDMGSCSFNHNFFIIWGGVERMKFKLESLSWFPIWLKLPSLAWEFRGMELLVGYD